MNDAVPADILSDVVRWRRAIHRHPELGFEEERTAALIESELARAGVDAVRVAKTGIIATLRGGKPGKTVALRADMDALPIHERSGESFESEVPGKMHACGHDGHSAMLLGAAVALARERASLSGTIKFFFQPAEEGPGGALPLIEAGAMRGVDAVVMIHVWPTLPAGTVGIRRGPAMASCDDFDIEIRGRGGHGGYPHSAVDTIPIAAELVGALQRIASREIDPLESIVVAIGRIDGGYRRNVIADTTRIAGTVRCLDERVRATISERIERITRGVCEAHRAAGLVTFVRGYPSVHNDPAIAERIAVIARSTDGIPAVVDLDRPTMGAEDFSYYTHEAPGCMIRLGSSAPGKADPPMLHSAEFRLDESALPVGVRLFRALAHRLPAEL
ncbi:MAG TPA: amidohydrolase [Candidatus Eremiobacteraceae bacterium]|nr:amidohydrolase [Candidatus Eremiobacteraceae bacterium]